MPASKHADLLNALDQMAQSLVYAVRRNELRSAESIIQAQEMEIDALKKAMAQMEIDADEEIARLEKIIPDAGYPSPKFR